MRYTFSTAAVAAATLALFTTSVQAISDKDAKNLTSIGYIYTYPIMQTYKAMYTVRPSLLSTHPSTPFTHPLQQVQTAHARLGTLPTTSSSHPPTSPN